MCGIAGELNFGASPSGADWQQISAMMTRRGPDDSGLNKPDHNCTMVFRRLSILDLSPNGHQPMVSQDGRYSIVFNGEVYNFKELRKQLSQKGIQFHSEGDTEVVLYSLIEWGVEALDKFNGMFALAFYDSLEKRIVLARDHAGIKPLYYLQTTKGVVFSWQNNKILKHPGSSNIIISKDAVGV